MKERKGQMGGRCSAYLAEQPLVGILVPLGWAG